jgi:hypothetical protein
VPHFESRATLRTMVTRNPANNPRLLKEQYELLKDSVAEFYAGKEIKALDVAVRIRTLVHDTDKSQALLSLLAANYRELDIYHKLPSGDAVFVVNQSFRLSGDGAVKIVRDDFSSIAYTLVSLERWWTEKYLIMGAVRSSKKQVVTDVANKDGGAHLASEVPIRHAAASEPPLILGRNENAVRPNLARGIVAQAGNEMLNYIERHFSLYIR